VEVPPGAGAHTPTERSRRRWSDRPRLPPTGRWSPDWVPLVAQVLSGSTAAVGGCCGGPRWRGYPHASPSRSRRRPRFPARAVRPARYSPRRPLRLAAGCPLRLAAGCRVRLAAGCRVRLAAGCRVRLAAGYRVRRAAGRRARPPPARAQPFPSTGLRTRPIWTLWTTSARRAAGPAARLPW